MFCRIISPMVMIKNKQSLMDIRDDLVATVWRKRHRFFINHGLEFPDDMDNNIYYAAQHELVYRQQTRICQHRVWCDVSQLRAYDGIYASLGFWMPSDNMIHTFDYVPVDTAYPEGVYGLKRLHESNPGTLYHEIRHAYNHRCILINNAQQSYATWALDELMTMTGGWLAAFSDMPDFSDGAVSINVNYTPGPSFNKKIVRDVMESALYAGLDELKEGRDQYQQAWLEFELNPIINYVRSGSNHTIRAWRRMRTFLVHGRGMDIYDCINSKLRRQMDKMIFTRPQGCQR